MATFEVGQKVIVTGVTLYGSFEGCEGIIIRKGMFHDWLVYVTFPDGTHDDLSFDAHELAPAAAEPTADGGGDAERHLNMVLSELRSVTERIPHDVRLPGSPKLTQEMADLLDKFIALRTELASVQAQRDAAVAALQPFALAYHVFNDQFASDYGDIINWQTDFANVNAVTEWYKQALAVVGVEQALPAAALPGEGE